MAYQVITTQLDRPVALAIVPDSTVTTGTVQPDSTPEQPATPEPAGGIYISEAGVGRVTRMSRLAKRVPWLTGYSPTPPDAAVERPSAGSMGGMYALPSRQLLVAGLEPDGRATIRRYATAAAQATVEQGDLLWSARLPRGALPWGLTTNTQNLFAAISDDSATWGLLQVPVQSTHGEPLRWDQLAAYRLSGLVQSPRDEIVVAARGAWSDELDARLAFLHPQDGRVLLDLAMDRRDVVSLAYSPNGRLYGIDMAAESSEPGGLFRIDSRYHLGRLAVHCVWIARLDRPTALAFDRDGSLYVTLWGPAGKPHPSGQLIRFAAGL
jgi:hypothetical protein